MDEHAPGFVTTPALAARLQAYKWMASACAVDALARKPRTVA
jgi:hypothetical protein